MASSLCAKPVLLARPAPLAKRPAAAKPQRAARFMVNSAPDKAAIDAAIKEAEEACEGGVNGEW
jgi:hypothetical protein